MNEARHDILARLRCQSLPAPATPSNRPAAHPCEHEWCIARFSKQQQAVRGEVYRLKQTQWMNWLAVELRRRGLKRILLGTGTIGTEMGTTPPRGIELIHYTQAVEHCKNELFTQVDAAITGAHCAIAETGSLVLWPDRQEPRLMSLVPPVHIALLDAKKIYPTLSSALKAEQWKERMPTNALLISGPSKTADIEQTLAYGIHGPKELITLILE